jgi:hypothetical protein
MTEQRWWSSHLRPLLHRPGRGCCAWKLTDAWRVGVPDVIVCYQGKVTWLEIEVAQAPVRATTPIAMPHYTTEQRAHLREWSMCKGNAYVLLLVGQAWFLLPHNIPNPFDQRATQRIIVASGPVGTYDTLIAKLKPQEET